MGGGGMRERYAVVKESPESITREGSMVIVPVFSIVDRRTPELPVCWCFNPDAAAKIVTALNRQYRDGAERRAARKAYA